MTAPRDADRLIRAFLREGPTELPDRTFDTVRAVIERTHQRVVIGPWRKPTMPNLLRGLAATAITVVAVVGLALIPRPPGVGGTSPSPAADPSGRSTSAPAPAFPTYTWPGELAAGTYNTSFAWEIPFAIRFTVPSGWQSRDIELLRGPDADPMAWVSFQLVDNVYLDPCEHVLADPAVGPTVTDLATAFAAIPLIAATEPVDVTIGTMPAKYIEYSELAAAPACSQDVRLWSSPVGSVLPFGPYGDPFWPLRPGSHRVWIVDVDGQRLVIDAGVAHGTPDAIIREELAIIDSLDINPLSEIRTGGECLLQLSSPAGDVLVAPPYRLRLQDKQFPVQGPFPVDAQDHPLTPAPPLAQLDASGSAWHGSQGNSATISIVPTRDRVGTGFSTSTPVNGFHGSVVFDSVGTWWVRVVSQQSGCAVQFPVEVYGP